MVHPQVNLCQDSSLTEYTLAITNNLRYNSLRFDHNSTCLDMKKWKLHSFTFYYYFWNHGEDHYYMHGMKCQQHTF